MWRIVLLWIPEKVDRRTLKASVQQKFAGNKMCGEVINERVTVMMKNVTDLCIDLMRRLVTKDLVGVSCDEGYG